MMSELIHTLYDSFRVVECEDGSIYIEKMDSHQRMTFQSRTAMWDLINSLSPILPQPEGSDVRLRYVGEAGHYDVE